MTRRALSFLDAVANVAIITASIAVVAVAWKAYRADNQRHSDEFQIGTKVAVDGVQFSHRSNLVLVLSTRCKFCTDSMPFYRRIAAASTGRSDIELISLFPQDPTTAAEYLKQNGLALHRVVQVSLDALKVRCTPTLLLVDNAGILVDRWRGRLSSDQEREVLRKLGFE
jgi:hypothetical protein